MNYVLPPLPTNAFTVYNGQVLILEGSIAKSYKQKKAHITTITTTTTTTTTTTDNDNNNNNNNNNICLRVQLIVYFFKYGRFLRDCTVSETLF
jgi:hypothetical protein